jgi:hypothetical protein
MHFWHNLQCNLLNTYWCEKCSGQSLQTDVNSNILFQSTFSDKKAATKQDSEHTVSVTLCVYFTIYSKTKGDSR